MFAEDCSGTLERIERIDDPQSRTHAWLVRIQRRGTIHSKMFSDGLYDSPDKALHAAILWRNEMLARLTPYTLPDLMNLVRRNNQSGVPGVCRTCKERSGKRNWYWTARWSPTPKSTKTAYFSIAKYGEEGAKQLAIAAREKALKEISGYWIGRRVGKSENRATLLSLEI